MGAVSVRAALALALIVVGACGARAGLDVDDTAPWDPDAGLAPGPFPLDASVDRALVPVARGIQITDEDRLRRAVIERLMCDMEADLDAICRSHNAASHALDHFRDEIGRLDFMVRGGLVTIDGTKLAIPEAARNFVRVVASVFDQYIENSKAKHSVAV